MSEINKPRGYIQLPLPFYAQERNTFENFYPGSSNSKFLNYLRQFLLNKEFEHHCIYIWGHSFVGCSHLLQASYHAAKNNNTQSIYIPLNFIQKTHEPACLRQMVDYQLVCIDALDCIAGLLDWEEELFHLYNNLQTQNAAIIFAAHQVPHKLNLKLPDLVSRLNSGLLFQIHELTDQEKIFALQLRAQLHGLVLPDTVAQFLLLRLVRSPHILFNTFEKLDRASLTQQRKLTIPFVKSVLNL